MTIYDIVDKLHSVNSLPELRDLERGLRQRLYFVEVSSETHFDKWRELGEPIAKENSLNCNWAQYGFHSIDKCRQFVEKVRQYDDKLLARVFKIRPVDVFMESELVE